jgi:hypothetical protein
MGPKTACSSSFYGRMGTIAVKRVAAAYSKKKKKLWK